MDRSTHKKRMNIQSSLSHLRAYGFHIKRRTAGEFQLPENRTPRIVADTPRRQARRQQVLEAAARCFRQYGFHSSSMMKISQESGMSVGLIYRYFSSKEEIIAAIVQQDVDEILLKATNLPKDGPNLRQKITEQAGEGVMDAADREKAALMLEIRAEAARNPEIHAVVRAADDKISQHLIQIVSAAVGKKLDKDDLAARVEMFQLIFQGIGLRTVINPDIDIKAISRLVKITIDAVLN